MARLTTSGRFTVLAIDHGDVLRRHFEAEGADSTAPNIEQSKLAVVKSLASNCSAVLVDVGLAQNPEFVRTMTDAGGGLLISVDEANYDAVSQPPPAIPDGDLIERAKRAGAAALKVVVYYDRGSPDANVRQQRIASIAEMSEKAGLPLLVEPLPTGPESEIEWPVALVARDMADAGAAVVKVPLPDRPEREIRRLAEATTNVLGAVPWIVLSSGIAFPEFLGRLRGAMAGGASGFAAGRSIWGDLITRPTDVHAMDEARRRLTLAIEATIGHMPIANQGAASS